MSVCARMCRHSGRARKQILAGRETRKLQIHSEWPFLINLILLANSCVSVLTQLSAFRVRPRALSSMNRSTSSTKFMQEGAHNNNSSLSTHTFVSASAKFRLKSIPRQKYFCGFSIVCRSRLNSRHDHILRSILQSTNDGWRRPTDAVICGLDRLKRRGWL